MYKNFEKIDGTHPWRKVSAEGYLDYPVRYRAGGRVLFFNFPLAKEMGLISKNHPTRMNPKLEEAILKTFSIQILNEHDWMTKKRFPLDGYEDRLYMATRYLQVQHASKQGKTSGDGRSIWNGYIKHRSKTYDISSRGTGNTILSPGAQDVNKPIATGDESYGYSSGLADLDEMLAGAVMSEIFYRRGVPTERCLTVIDYKDKTSIGVRTAPNLIRPAHFFRYLKSAELEELKKAYDYFIKRQESNNAMNLPVEGKARYFKSLEYLTETYAKLVALMEEEYIFNWLAWDGDNLLASGAILDYGSIRQFAAKHNKYRYDDVDRYSTCLTEQRREARYLIQTFVQVVDYITSGEKKNIKEFEQSKYCQLFDQHFKEEIQRRMLWRMGFNSQQTKILMDNHQQKVEAFRKALNYFEEIKTSEGEKAVADGIDHPPIFLVRRILRDLPDFLLKHRQARVWPIMPAEEFCEIMAASYVDKEDLALTPTREEKAFEFQRLYQDLIYSVSRKHWVTLKSVAKRAAVTNYANRSTGDGLTWIVMEIINSRERMDRQQIQEVLNRFIESQVLLPGKWRPITANEMKGPSLKARQLRKMQETLETYNELI